MFQCAVELRWPALISHCLDIRAELLVEVDLKGMQIMAGIRVATSALGCRTIDHCSEHLEG